MKKVLNPTTTQANLAFLMLILLIYAGSSVLVPLVGMGTNLWINEFVYILFPALLLARLNGWSLEGTYRYRKTTGKNKALGIFCGISMWFFSAYAAKLTGLLLDAGVGPFVLDAAVLNNSPIQSILLFIGMVILAPICEETFFRGLVQRGYEGRSRKYGYVFAGLIFGLFHLLNGMENVIPACFIGIVLGYLVYRTDSIYTSMLAHGANNACAILFGGIFSVPGMAAVPITMHILGIGGLAVLLLLLSRLKENKKGGESADELPAAKRLSIASTVFLALSVMFLIAAGILEILTRLGKFNA